MRLHIVRHGATETSGDTYAGRRDVALTEEGHRQARAVAAALERCNLGVILASPLSRAVATARPLAERLGLKIRIEPALTEFDFGDFEGRSKSKTGLRLRKSHLVEPVPGGESLNDVWARAGVVLAHLERAATDTGGGDAALFGHFWINRLIFGRAAGMGFEDACNHRGFRPRTGEIRTVEFFLGKINATRI